MTLRNDYLHSRFSVIHKVDTVRANDFIKNSKFRPVRFDVAISAMSAQYLRLNYSGVAFKSDPR